MVTVSSKSPKTSEQPAPEPEVALPPDIALLNDPVRRADPFAQIGTMDTSGTGGAQDNSVAAVSPIFAEARRWDLETAAKALDPDDDTPNELVVLPEGTVTITGTTKTPAEGRDDVRRALERTAGN